jgi:hypothetical protein
VLKVPLQADAEDVAGLVALEASAIRRPVLGSRYMA